jgi:hypothetical protein
MVSQQAVLEINGSFDVEDLNHGKYWKQAADVMTEIT